MRLMRVRRDTPRISRRARLIALRGLERAGDALLLVHQRLRGPVEEQVLRLDRASLGECQRPFDDVAKLAHVAGPRMAVQARDGRGRQGGGSDPGVLGRLREELLRERYDALAPRTKRRDGHRDAREAVVQVSPERPFGDERLQVAVRRGHEPDVGRDGTERSEPQRLARLEHAQQRGLGGRRHLPDLVEKERAAVGRLDEPRLGVQRSRERAFLVAEELSLEQRLRERGAVEAHHGPRGAARTPVDRLGGHLLADARLPDDKDAESTLRHQPEEVLELRLPLDCRLRRLRRGTAHVALNDDERRAHLRDLTGRERARSGDGDAVDPCAVRAAEVLEGGRRARAQHGVPARHRLVQNLDVAVLAAPEHEILCPRRGRE